MKRFIVIVVLLVLVGWFFHWYDQNYGDTEYTDQYDEYLDEDLNEDTDPDEDPDPVLSQDDDEDPRPVRPTENDEEPVTEEDEENDRPDLADLFNSGEDDEEDFTDNGIRPHNPDYSDNDNGGGSRPHVVDPGSQDVKVENGFFLVSHSWEDYDDNGYETQFRLSNAEYLKSLKERDQFMPAECSDIDYDFTNGKFNYDCDEDDDFSLWKELYDYLYIKNKDRMGNLIDYFNEVAEKEDLNHLERAQLVLSCIQGFKYEHTYSSFLDIYTPPQFIHERSGDCDSRTVLLYTVLTKMGYDVVILGSNYYGHSMLGINVAAYGKYKYWRGKKYYFCEATAKGFDIGALPSDFSNPKYWEIDLDSRIQ